MESNTLVLPAHPAAADLLASELYNQHHIDANVKNQLASNLTSHLKQDQKVEVLILGGRCGLVADILLPFCSRLDIVEQDPYIGILEERFLKQRPIDYFFGREGFIGSRHTCPPPPVADTVVRVVRAEDLREKAGKFYHMILVQNNIITAKSNLIEELIGINHEQLITMMVPGKIENPKLFQFYALFERNIINAYYQNLLYERLQNRRSVTGRREEIIYYEIFVFRRNQKPIDEQGIKRLLATEREETAAKLPENPYETKKMVDTYLNFHYGESYFGIGNFPLKCAQICIEEAKKHHIQGRALDLGCAVGRTTIQLAHYFEQVVGLDYSKAFVTSADQILKSKYSSIESKVKFMVGDACNLDPTLGKFNLVFGGNLIDRLPDPFAFVRSVTDFLLPGGILILTSPYSWLAQFTAPQKWLGGIISNGVQVSTESGLRQIFEGKGVKQLRDSENIRFVIKINDWVYQYTLANATYWIMDL